MSEHLEQTAYPGQIDIGGDRSPVSYKLIARKDDSGSFRVSLSLTAPRDWLLKHGFSKDAVLVRQGGAEVPVHSDSPVEVGDNVAVTLNAKDAVLASEDDLHRQFPELAAA